MTDNIDTVVELRIREVGPFEGMKHGGMKHGTSRLTISDGVTAMFFGVLVHRQDGWWFTSEENAAADINGYTSSLSALDELLKARSTELSKYMHGIHPKKEQGDTHE